MFVIFASRFCNFLPIRFVFCVAEPGPAHTSTAIGPTGDQDGPRSEGLRDQLGS